MEAWIERFLMTHERDAWAGGYKLCHLPEPGSLLDQDARDLHAFAIIRDTLTEAASAVTDDADARRKAHAAAKA